MPDLKMLNSTKYLYKLTFIKRSYEPLPAGAFAPPEPMYHYPKRLSDYNKSKFNVPYSFIHANLGIFVRIFF